VQQVADVLQTRLQTVLELLLVLLEGELADELAPVYHLPLHTTQLAVVQQEVNLFRCQGDVQPTQGLLES
jgi:hypothetical protein